MAAEVAGADEGVDVAEEGVEALDVVHDLRP